MTPTEVNAIISDSIATTSSVLTTSLPVIFGLGVTLLALGLAWFYFKKLIARRK